ncbi:hypothetical protein Bca4012_067313 [Brassica carinata]
MIRFTNLLAKFEAFQNSFDEVPLKSIIGFGHVRLDRHAAIAYAVISGAGDGWPDSSFDNIPRFRDRVARVLRRVNSRAVICNLVCDLSLLERLKKNTKEEDLNLSDGEQKVIFDCCSLSIAPLDQLLSMMAAKATTVITARGMRDKTTAGDVPLCQGQGVCYYITFVCPGECLKRNPHKNKSTKGCFVDHPSKCEATSKCKYILFNSSPLFSFRVTSLTSSIVIRIPCDKNMDFSCGLVSFQTKKRFTYNPRKLSLTLLYYFLQGGNQTATATVIYATTLDLSEETIGCSISMDPK